MYTDTKYWLSDNICSGTSDFSSSFFLKACPRLLDGLWVTIELLTIASVVGFFLAVLIAFGRLSRIKVISFFCELYAYLFRGTPLLVQLWIFYYGLGGLGEDVLGEVLWVFFRDAWFVGLSVLILNTAAYSSEIIRGGVVNVHKGQMEAALAIGMNRFKAMRRIILPQALKMAWPAYGNEVILLMKGSALISTIAVLDLMGQTRTIFARSFDMSIYLYAACMYLLLAGLLSLILLSLGKRLQ